MAALRDVELVDVAVGADEVDVLSEVEVGIGIERAVGGRKNAAAGDNP